MSPAIDTTLTIRPRPAARIGSSAAIVPLIVPAALTSSISVRVRSSCSQAGPGMSTPALLTHTWSEPARRIVREAAARQARKLRTSKAEANARSPSPAAARAARSTSRSVRCTKYPRPTSRRAISRPSPRAAPVTSAPPRSGGGSSGAAVIVSDVRWSGGWRWCSIARRWLPVWAPSPAVAAGTLTGWCGLYSYGCQRIGHGGASALAPANTLASFDAALELGVDMIEFDVRDLGRRAPGPAQPSVAQLAGAGAGGPGRAALGCADGPAPAGRPPAAGCGRRAAGTAVRVDGQRAGGARAAAGGGRARDRHRRPAAVRLSGRRRRGRGRPRGRRRGRGGGRLRRGRQGRGDRDGATGTGRPERGDRDGRPDVRVAYAAARGHAEAERAGSAAQPGPRLRAGVPARVCRLRPVGADSAGHDRALAPGHRLRRCGGCRAGRAGGVGGAPDANPGQALPPLRWRLSAGHVLQRARADVGRTTDDGGAGRGGRRLGRRRGGGDAVGPPRPRALAAGPAEPGGGGGLRDLGRGPAGERPPAPPAPRRRGAARPLELQGHRAGHRRSRQQRRLLAAGGGGAAGLRRGAARRRGGGIPHAGPGGGEAVAARRRAALDRRRTGDPRLGPVRGRGIAGGAGGGERSKGAGARGRPAPGGAGG